ncbi:MAG: hypothetical protein HYZ26_11355 [Chloroflexi bacterium]|nr:hypothetical protein [Chloroflexota bacterium]
MATKKTNRPMAKTKGSKKAPMPQSGVSAVLVVKGAGPQGQDETLDAFLRGFLPAVNVVANDHAVRERSDLALEGQPPMPRVAEIDARLKDGSQRRLWVKEAYWENALRRRGALTPLMGEWHMATYAWGRVLYDWLRGTLPKERQKDFWLFYLYFFLMHYLVFLFPVFALSQPANPMQVLQAVLGTALFTGLVVWPRARLSRAVFDLPLNERRPISGIFGWVLATLAAAILYSPLLYLRWAATLVLIILPLLWARGRVWRLREFPDSDTNWRNYYSYKKRVTPRKYVTRTIQRYVPTMSSILYRYLLVLLLPIGLIVVLLSQAMIWSKVLEAPGKWLDYVVSVAMSDFMGDIVLYARFPDQAQRVRSTLIDQIQFFHQHPDVKEIHVFAHSLGTVIGYETLFKHLPREYRSKIKTYVTVGSVLSAMNKANAALDERYTQRFPVYPPEEGYGFAEGFRWFNCWNLLDPATEFYSLDEYFVPRSAPEMPKDHGRTLPELPREERMRILPEDYCPINIKTPFTDLHSGYWNNLADVHKPFAERIFGMVPKRWDMEALAEAENLATNSARYYRRALAVNRLGLALVSGAAGAVVGQLLWALYTTVSDWMNGLLVDWIGQFQSTVDLLLWAGSPAVRLGLLTLLSLLLAGAWLQDVLVWRQLQRRLALKR